MKGDQITRILPQARGGKPGVLGGKPTEPTAYCFTVEGAFRDGTPFVAEEVGVEHLESPDVLERCVRYRTGRPFRLTGVYPWYRWVPRWIASSVQANAFSAKWWGYLESKWEVPK